ncbi:MAG: hypothetical protein LBJ67_01370 [Planctomycetaceae bacterium]|jgi:hypothetical protein|nr:hypothetical protein [Planctomycetaceae bacterium]
MLEQMSTAAERQVSRESSNWQTIARVGKFSVRVNNKIFLLLSHFGEELVYTIL